MVAPAFPLEQIATAEEARASGIRAYKAHGSALKLRKCRDSEVLMSGPAGTGKSRACLEKINLAACVYAGMRALIIRKTRESLTESALVTFEDHVIAPTNPALATGGQRKNRQSYQYPNGSVIVIGGMDKPGKVMSTEFDLIYVQEAIELTENDWESLTSRLRNGKMPYQQLIADTNPDAPLHWLKQRCNNKQTTLIDCQHEDNPVYFDPKVKAWTPRGLAYLSKLDALTGHRKDRLRKGKWVQAEGVVYDNWNSAIHLIDRFTIPKSWTRFLAVDFGYVNPFVCQWWAVDDDGRLYRYREIYRTKRLVEEHAADIIDAAKEMGESIEMIGGIVCDHDAEGRATLEKHLGRGTTAAIKEVREGIQAVATRLTVAGDGKPRLFLLRDSLVSRDQALSDAKKPCCTEEEVDGYIWDKEKSRTQGEEPVKINDHGCDCSRYATRYADAGAGVWTFSGSPPEDNAIAKLPGAVFQEGRREDRREPSGESVDYMGMRF